VLHRSRINKPSSLFVKGRVTHEGNTLLGGGLLTLCFGRGLARQAVISSDQCDKTQKKKKKTVTSLMGVHEY